MSESQSQPTLIHRSGLEAQYGKYAVVSVSAAAEQYSQLLALGETIAEEYGIAPAMVQLTPLAAEPVATIRYLITVTKSTGKR
ncbi:MAG: hypothetical protein Q8T09_08430 [Candidatus Melainabacteria bacterium]|nr:hypothetical protein [Candidatus Melainabacteria bacterium]